MNALVATAAPTDVSLRLPCLDPSIPIDVILEYRRTHEAELGMVRDKLATMARRIEREPWSQGFARELEHRTIPDIADALAEAGKARDAWLATRRTKMTLSAVGIAGGAASAVLGVIAAPVTPIAIAVAAVSLATGSVIPGMEWLQNWREGKGAIQQNGLHYLLTTGK